MKIINDKYYTPINLANHCWDKALDVIGEKNISEIIEPSCGNGSFLTYLKKFPNFAYDIEPECQDLCNGFTNVIKADFLTHNIEYLRGRLIIGNPPYGRCLSLAQKFYKKSIEISDYIAFILPISQLNNSQSMYEFDLIYSEDLGIQKYSNRNLHCCFNIYRRPNDGLNKKVITKLKDISIYRQDCDGYEEKDFDIRICNWGNGTVGKILSNNEHYSGEYKIKINNLQLKNKIIHIIASFDWKQSLKTISSKKLYQFHIIDVLKKEIPEIK